MSSGTEVHGGDTSPKRQPRQNRIHSVGLPVHTSLVREPSTTGSPVPLPIPRRHSATPTVAPPPIPLRPPAIPKRSKNEKPIPIRFPTTTTTTTGQKGQVDRGKRSNNTRTPPNDAKPALPTSRDDFANEELIDLGPCRTQRQEPNRPKANCENRQCASNSGGPAENKFVADFDKLGFANDSQKSNFEQLQKASRDLEKILHERIVKSTAEPGQRRASTNAQTNGLQSSKMGKEGNVDSRDDTTDTKSREKIIPPRGKEALQEDENKFAALMKMRRETEKRCKFEELQAASKKLETRLHEEDGDDEQEEEEEEEVQEAEEEKAPSSHGTNKEKPVVDRYEELRRASQELERRLRSEQRSTATMPRGKYEIDTDRTRNIQQQQNLRKERTCEKLEKLPKATQTNLPPPLSAISQSSMPKPVSVRQDSNVSSDSFSQTSSPSYTSKTMEAPLLPHKYGKVPDRALVPEPDNASGRTITKSTSTPASLQTIVRVHGGNNGSLRHKIIRDMTSSHYVTNGRLRFRFVQVLFNAVALLIIAGGLAIYVRSYPETIIGPENKPIYANKIAFTERAPVTIEDKNPAPGVCLPIIVTFCQYHKIPYNFTVFPNYIGNYGQHDAQQELELYGSVINVRCYELAALFLCTVFVPKCGSQGHDVRPCRSLCSQTKRRCGFFLGVFGLNLLDYLECDQFPENANPDECVGHREVQEAARRAEKPVCTSGFQCDENICIPVDWRCDGHVDCKDRTDEKGCGNCTASSSSSSISLASKIIKKPILAKNTNVESVLHCGERRCMSANDICDGVMNCPWGQDERYCLRLSQRNGDVGEGRLEVYHAEMGKFMPACVAYWDSNTPNDICSMLGYTTAVSSRLEPRDANVTRGAEFMNRRRTNLLKDFQECITDQEQYPTAELTCTKYACGRRKTLYGNSKVQTRIVGGVESAPGDWPFLAAVLGGPEQIFYCAGVLIADQWVLTASHCVGNHTDVTGWTIQLGITRRHSHTFLGQKLKVRRVIPHPSYNLGSDHDNDVALFQLERRVEFHEHLRPVCLPSPHTHLIPGTLCTVIGWGKKNDIDTSEYEPAVNEVQVPVLKREICSLWLEHSSKLNVTDGMICAGYPDGGKDACQGDSGGPLLCQDAADKEKWIVGGIVSWGIKCAHPKLPGVYAYVPKYVPWIRREMDKYSDVSMG
ncbi:atrial natriuretic peptide-converting enzyme-like [Ceratina calcarata]|uniref:Acrosin n=1 Tax=Ceratina calcarata TaxID=156304 RepID=A0AAJ7IU83_9HYME|nr:atrial natriuretic peptide-converting enzyme-like [Ceratina calcarata]